MNDSSRGRNDVSIMKDNNCNMPAFDYFRIGLRDTLLISFETARLDSAVYFVRKSSGRIKYLWIEPLVVFSE